MTGDELYTRCPTCKTVFRTHDAQLAVQAGKVRCGQCRMVFDGRAHLVDLLPEPHAADYERVQGPPTVTLRDSIALEPAASPPVQPPGTAANPEGMRPAASVGSGVAEGGTFETAQQANRTDAGALDDPEATVLTAAPGAAAPQSANVHHFAETSKSAPMPKSSDASESRATEEPADEEIVPYDWRRERLPSSRPGVRWALGIASAALVLILAGQAIFQFRHAIAANFPQLRPNLVAACATFGCTIDALRRREEITIESHDLQADPAHQGLLILQLTLRNHASYAVAFPHLELEILDIGGQPQARRALAPLDYAGGAADFARGMPANAEWHVKLFIDASGIGARGYNLDLFYP